MKLTDTQLVILSAAAQREDRTALPVPASIKLKGATLDKALDGLRRKGLLAEHPADPGDEAWRESETGEQTTLVITEAGLEAIGIQPPVPAELSQDQRRATGRRSRTARRSKPAPTRRRGPPPTVQKHPPRRHQSRVDAVQPDDAKPSVSSPRAGTKLDKVIGMLRRKNGASVSDIAATTGWQPHTVRAALTGLRKRGLAVVREKGRDGSVHRIARA